MNFLEAIISIIIPFVPVFLPGVFLVKMKSFKDILLQGSYILLASMTITTIALTVGLWFGIAVESTFAVLMVMGVVFVGMQNRFVIPGLLRPAKLSSEVGTRNPRLSAVLAGGSRLGGRDDGSRQLLFVILCILLPVGIFMVPFLKFHNGLPTGDVQKTIIFANEIIATHHIPDYARSILFLNRDPVDFYTPGLHAISALVMRLSPAPLMSMGIFSLVMAVCVSFITAAIAFQLFPEKKYRFVPLLSAIFVLTQHRFLRYIREPGYHFQNVVGEFFLFGMLLLAISFIRNKKIHDGVLFFLCAIALFLSHQFSMFIAAFMFLVAFLWLAISNRKNVLHVLRTHRKFFAIAALGIITAAFMGISLGLIKKIPALFTLHPHLANLLPNIADYPTVLGALWFFASIAGLILLGRSAYKWPHYRNEKVFFISASAAILALSQGPALGIDIPPVRALFYCAVPLSIAAAYFFIILGRMHKVLGIISVFLVISAILSSVSHAYTTLSHTVRTNSTLGAEQLGLIDQLRPNASSGILIDDYNRRSASWLVLSGRAMFTRIAADLQTQMKESAQSPLRNQLYLHQLDYEKIFMLGSRPEAAVLLAANNIGAVTGIAHASESTFAHNSLLRVIGKADDITAFALQDDAVHECDKNSECEFLVQPTTLANDIGDDEDVYEHLEASVRSSRLSDPKIKNNVTYRETTAAYIPLVFNVDDYVRVLWDKSNVGKIDIPLVLHLSLTAPVKGLSLVASNGASIPLVPHMQSSVMLSPDMLPIDNRGFITLTLVNPTHQRVGIDLIALGI